MRPLFFAPGFGGSDLATTVGQGHVWANIFSLVKSGLWPMRLAANGITPAGPYDGRLYTSGLALEPIILGNKTSILLQTYSALLTGIRNVSGHDPYFFSYDWRQTLDLAGARLAGQVQQLATPAEPATLIGHSAGGLVCRLAWRALVIAGKENLVRRVITVCTPNRGSYSALELLLGLEDTVQQVLRERSVVNSFKFVATMDLEDAQIIVATWPGAYWLLPMLDSASAFNDALRVRLYQADRWETAVDNRWLQDARNVFQELLKDARSVPPWHVWTTVIGTGILTPWSLLTANDFGPGGYTFSFTDDGDGKVAADSADDPVAFRYIFDGTHLGMPNSRPFLDRLDSMVNDERTAPDPLPPPVRIREQTPDWSFHPPIGLTPIDAPVRRVSDAGDP